MSRFVKDSLAMNFLSLTWNQQLRLLMIIFKVLIKIEIAALFIIKLLMVTRFTMHKVKRHFNNCKIQKSKILLFALYWTP